MSAKLNLERALGSLDLTLEKLEDLPDGKTLHRVAGVSCAERGVLPGIPTQVFGPLKFSRQAPVGAAAEGEQGRAAVQVERAEGSLAAISGVASSTSVDWYGTEMDRSALDEMAEQFAAGVAITPRHNGFFSPVEWDDVIGLTNGAAVESAEVVNPADADEPGFSLSLTGDLYDVEKGRSLENRLSLGQPIGLSIGGWFLDVRVISDEEGDVERIIIQSVLLDHVAVTRAPANPDSTGLQLLRSKLSDAVGRARQDLAARSKATAATPSPEPAPDAGDPNEELSAQAGEDAGSGESGKSGSPAQDNQARERGDAGSATDTVESERGAPADLEAPTDPSATEADMTPEQLRAILDEKLSPMNKRLAALEADRSKGDPKPGAAKGGAEGAAEGASARSQGAEFDPASLPAEVRAKLEKAEALEAERDALKRDNAALGNRIERVAAAGGRRGRVPDNAYAVERGTKGSNIQFRSLCTGARDEGHAALAELSERSETVLTADRYDPDVKRGDLERTLAGVINAAIADGIIQDRASSPVWA